MKTLYRSLVAIALLLVFAGHGFAQTYNTTTTLSTAVTARNQTNVTVASTTGFVNGYVLYVDHEAMTISSFNSTTGVVQVFRGAAGTGAALHSASSVVFWGVPSMFQNGDTDGQGRPTFGACTATNYPFLPIINVINGNVYLCRAFNSSGITPAQWTMTNSANWVYNSLLKNLS